MLSCSLPKSATKYATTEKTTRKTNNNKKAIRTRMFAFGSEGIPSSLLSRYAPVGGRLAALVLRPPLRRREYRSPDGAKRNPGSLSQRNGPRIALRSIRAMLARSAEMPRIALGLAWRRSRAADMAALATLRSRSNHVPGRCDRQHGLTSFEAPSSIMPTIAIGSQLAEVAQLIGDPGRANILATLMDGRALTAGELAAVAHVTPQTASAHLAKLVNRELLIVAKQGRHRYYRLATPLIARMLEGIM